MNTAIPCEVGPSSRPQIQDGEDGLQELSVKVRCPCACHGGSGSGGI